jgi:phospholipase/carboxylesterase
MADAGPGQETDPLLDATAALVPAVLVALEGLAHAARHMHPPHLPDVVATLEGIDEPLAAGIETFSAVDWPPQLTGFKDRMLEAAGAASRALAGLRDSVGDPNGVLKAYRSMRQTTLALEALYPIAQTFPPISRFFVDPVYREDGALLERILGGDASREDVGVMHGQNSREQRGGVSLYVPEYYDAARAWPLVIALHGGSGHGRDFLWSWLREARTRGVIVAAPTARGDTWSLMGRDIDALPLNDLVKRLSEHWNIDSSRVLLTGMSDGGTYSYLAGLRRDVPFTHLAPISGTFHPLLLDGVERDRTNGLPIYLVHGALDWMFSVEIARMARDALTAAGARVTYREIENLSHTYPREENMRILDWLLDA